VRTSKEREYFRSSQAHNTVSVDGSAQSVPGSAFSWVYIGQTRQRSNAETPSVSSITGEHTGFFRLSDPVRHVRTFVLRKSEGLRKDLFPYLLVLDHFNATEIHHYTLHWQYSPQCAVVEDCRKVIIFDGVGKRLAVMSMMIEGQGQISPLANTLEEGWASHCYGQREPAPRLIGKCVKKGSFTVITVLVPYKGTDSQRALRAFALDLEAIREDVGVEAKETLRDLPGWLSGDLYSN
jgi:hypothetical protein